MGVVPPLLVPCCPTTISSSSPEKSGAVVGEGSVSEMGVPCMDVSY